MDGMMDQAQMGRLFQEFIAERMGKPKPPFRDLWVRYEAYGTTRTDGGRMRINSWNDSQKWHQLRLLEYFGDLPFDQVDRIKADEYRGWRRGHIVKQTQKPPRTGSINRELRSAQGCLSYALRSGLITRNPLAGLKDEKPIHERDFALTQDQVMAIVEEARPLLRFYLIVLYETGMRASELRELPWSEVNIPGGYITLPWERTKGKREREIPLSDAALLILEMLPHDGVNPYVFPSPYCGELAPVAEATMKKWWREARDRSGVKGPKGQPVWLHTLRHSWATDMATAGLDMATMLNMGGWADKKMADRYTHIGRRHLDRAKEKINERSISIMRSLEQGKFGPRATSPGTVRRRLLADAE